MATVRVVKTLLPNFPLYGNAGYTLPSVRALAMFIDADTRQFALWMYIAWSRNVPSELRRVSVGRIEAVYTDRTRENLVLRTGIGREFLVTSGWRRIVADYDWAAQPFSANTFAAINPPLPEAANYPFNPYQRRASNSRTLYRDFTIPSGKNLAHINFYWKE